MTWYVNQEKACIQGIMGRYFRKGYRHPTTKGTIAGSICRELFHRLGTREYAPEAQPREVGVWVVQRIA